MTKELANILKNQLHNIPFLQVVAGIVQPVVDKKYSEDGNLAIVKKIPVSYDTTGFNNKDVGKERVLVPDKSKKSILYFEDFGSGPNPAGKANAISLITTIRVVCWLNKDLLGYGKHADITANCIDQILHRLITGTAINSGGFKKLFVYNPRILAQDAAIFSRYNYAEEVVQYLRPPFEYFAIDLSCRYDVNRVPCAGGVYRSNQLIPVKIPILIKDAPTNAKDYLDNGWYVPTQYPSGPTLTVPFLKDYNILQVVHNRQIVDGIEDNPLDYDAETTTWDFATNPIANLNDGDELFIWAALPEKNQ